MRIAHVQLFPLLSGVQRVSLEEIRCRHNVYNYTLICKEPGPLTEEVDRYDLKLHYISSLSRELSPFRDIVSLYKLWRFFRKEKFDVIHTHSSKTGVLGRIAARLAGCNKVVHTVHGFSFPAAKTRFDYLIYFFMEWFAKWFTSSLIVLTESDKEIAFKRLGYLSDKISLLPNGIDVPAVLDKKVLSSGVFRVVMVGRLDKQKDPKTFVKAAIRLSKLYPDVFFDLIGDGEYRAELIEIIKVEGVQDRISLLLWRNDVRELLKSYNLFVLSSRWEGMPLAVLEAQASGLPVVVTDIPGNRDLVCGAGGRVGRLFPVGDVDCLAGHIETYYLDRVLTKTHGDTAYENVKNNYSLDARLDRLDELYNARG